MTSRRLFIFVEGTDDERFFNRVITPMYEQHYDSVLCIQYRQETKAWVNNFLDGIKNADYIFVADLDEFPCVTARKAQIISTYKNLTADRILIVCKEIESWYLAGLNDDGCGQLGISADFKNTDHISKEEFDVIRPQVFSMRDFMLEIMDIFDQETAQAQNSSFRYCMQNKKWNTPPV